MTTEISPDSDIALAVIEQSCAVEDMGDEIVVLNISTGVYFSIREAGVPLWRDLAAGHSIAELCGLANGVMDPAVVRDFAEKLQTYGLMKAIAPIKPDGAALLGNYLAEGSGEVVFDVFEDMQDLILSDPIHEFDYERGWPFKTE